MTILNPIKNCFDEELFLLYKKAGGFIIMAGYETFSEKMLESYKKPFNIDDIYYFNRLADKCGLKIGTELLFGGPEENNKTIKESMDFLSKINYAFLTYGFGVRILPNTEIFEMAKNEGIIKSINELLFPKFYISKKMDIDWAIKYIKTNTGKFSYRSINLLPLLFENLSGRLLNKKY